MTVLSFIFDTVVGLAILLLAGGGFWVGRRFERAFPKGRA